MIARLASDRPRLGALVPCLRDQSESRGAGPQSKKRKDGRLTPLTGQLDDTIHRYEVGQLRGRYRSEWIYIFFKHERGASSLLHFVNYLADKLRACLAACCEYKFRMGWLAGSESLIAELVVYPNYIPVLARGLRQVRHDGHKTRSVDDIECIALRNSTNHHDRLPPARFCGETER